MIIMINNSYNSFSYNSLGSRKTNVLLSLIKNQQPDIDKNQSIYCLLTEHKKWELKN